MAKKRIWSPERREAARKRYVAGMAAKSESKPPDNSIKSTVDAGGDEDVSRYLNGIPVVGIGAGGAGDAGAGAGGNRDSGDARGDSRAKAGAGGAKGKTSSRVDDLNVYAGALQGISDVAAFLLKIPELGDLDDDEANKLAKALRAVQKYHPAMDLAGEALAWIGLCAAISQVYGTRIAAYTLRTRTEKQDKAKAEPRPFAMPSGAGFAPAM
jgi:hypothetical protein